MLQFFDARDLVCRFQCGPGFRNTQGGGHVLHGCVRIAGQYFEIEPGSAQAGYGGCRIGAHGIGQAETDQLATGNSEAHFAVAVIGCDTSAGGYFCHPVSPPEAYLLRFPHCFHAKARMFDHIGQQQAGAVFMKARDSLCSGMG